MAPRVQNRRSATESNPPDAGTLLAGEIAINTNATTANIHFEDAGGDVRSVGADPAAVGKYLREVSAENGVGEWVAAQAGAIIDNDPPAEDDREDGTLWFRPENQTLWVWDETNSTWAPAVPQVPAGGGGDYAAGELREQVFFNNEQTVDNDYTVESTVNSLSAGPITLDAAATVTIEDGGSWTVVGGAGQTIDPTGFWGRSGTTLSPATPGDDLDNIGSINAAGNADIGTFDVDGVRIYPAGNVSVWRTAGDDAAKTFASSWQGTETFGVTAAGSINAAGGKFEGNVNGDYILRVKNTNSTNPNGMLIDLRDVDSDNNYLALRIVGHNNEVGLQVNSDGQLTSQAQITADVSNTGGNKAAIKAIQTDSNGYALWVGNGPDAADRKAWILPDGRGFFNSTVDGGRLQVTKQTGDYQVFQVRNGGPSATKTAWIAANGTASFQSTTGFNVFIQLEPDNPANYVSTTNADGETESVYSGPQLDVKEVLLTLQAKIQTLEAKLAALSGPSTTDIQEAN